MRTVNIPQIEQKARGEFEMRVFKHHRENCVFVCVCAHACVFVQLCV